jgi:hypothetical protein
MHPNVCTEFELIILNPELHLYTFPLPNPFNKFSTLFLRKLTKRERKQTNIFERKVYRIILGPVYGNEKENL